MSEGLDSRMHGLKNLGVKIQLLVVRNETSIMMFKEKLCITTKTFRLKGINSNYNSETRSTCVERR